MFKEQIFPLGPPIKISCLPSSQDHVFSLYLEESTICSVSFFVDLPSFLSIDLLDWISSYVQKCPLPLPKLPRQNLPLFTSRVRRSLMSIPFGRTLSYEEIAIQAGSPKACRRVGTICRLNPWPLLIPCHRVIPKQQTLGSYALGSSIKKTLLEFEGSM